MKFNLNALFQEKGDSLHHRVLSTFSCPSSVEPSYWNITFNHLLEEWGLRVEKIKAVVCGSCRGEIVEAIMQRGLIVIPCLVQTLQVPMFFIELTISCKISR